jgi:hypothetical protein
VAGAVRGFQQSGLGADLINQIANKTYEECS